MSLRVVFRGDDVCGMGGARSVETAVVVSAYVCVRIVYGVGTLDYEVTNLR